MVARLKLKEIDGRAPPGVKQQRSAPKSSLIRVGGCFKILVGFKLVTPSNCGDILKLIATKLTSERCEWPG